MIEVIISSGVVVATLIGFYTIINLMRDEKIDYIEHERATTRMNYFFYIN